MNTNNIEKIFIKSPLSLVDDVGPVFFTKEKVYRAINYKFESYTRELINSGLINQLMDNGLFPRTEISDRIMDGYAFVIEHELISPIIYPYEWSPEMLRRAGECILTINKIANFYGYELKDAQPYNVLFLHGNPVFVDFGSFVKKESDSVWLAYEEFINCYCRPLILVERGLNDIYKHLFLLRGAMNANDLSRVTNRFYGFVGLRPTRVIRNIISILRRANSIDTKKIERRFKNPAVRFLVKIVLHSKIIPIKQLNLEALLKLIKSYKLTGVSKWSHYHTTAGVYTNSGEIELTPRMKWIVDKVESLSPKTVIELAGNQGVLSRAISHLPHVSRVLCTDYDLLAIDQLILRTKGNDKVYMACFDFMGDARESLSRERCNRFKSEIVIALAVTHHLALSQGFTIHSIIETISSYTSKYLIIEFMPLGLWDGTDAPPVPHWYNEEWFTKGLELYFTIIERTQLEKNRIVFIAKLQQ